MSERPAWARPTPGEPRWHASLLIIVIMVLQLLLPGLGDRHEQMVVPVVEAILLVILLVANPTQMNRNEAWLRTIQFLLLGVATAANAFAMARLIDQIITGGKASVDAGTLLSTGANVWLTNVMIFALWYWELDRGGPVARAVDPDPMPDFLFPQMALSYAPMQDREPRVFDYVYVSFTNATAFSPTDTMPLTRWAKSLMMFQSAVSLVTVALVVARAVNILP